MTSRLTTHHAATKANAANPTAFVQQGLRVANALQTEMGPQMLIRVADASTVRPVKKA